jgi:uncharacterized protein (TIGR02246 family)
LKHVTHTILIAVIVTALGCGQQNIASIPAQVTADFVAAYNARNAAAVASLYADDGELMPPDSRSIKGRAAIEAAFREKLEQGCVVSFTSSESGISGTQAFDTGRFTLTMPNGEGGSEIVSGRYVALLRREGGEWKITHHMQSIDPTADPVPQ